MRAAVLRRVDREYEIHLQAWTMQQVKATRNKGRSPRYKTFKDFFDYEARLKEARAGESSNHQDPHASYREYIKKRHRAALSDISDEYE